MRHLPGSGRRGRSCALHLLQQAPSVMIKKKDTVAGTPAFNWFKDEQGCDKYIHLECARKSAEYTANYKGAVPIAEAQYQILGVCPTCFEEMEA